ncbi:hypothetical protein AB2B41_09455 [Marimonas sp. MJW-29]|uniref:Uncharacterized protein n=1 Tax=Sulfitobacter sediminis TaxID=3234186 RepID=A0ABV3RLQ7_9RHOB
MRVLQAYRGLVVLGLLLSFALAPMLRAEDRPAGLMWNRTGLPAVFPLQVKTLAGPDYHLVLRDAVTGAPALAAYVEGGAFFRVLVPPGRYRLRFAYGSAWRGEEELFGPEMRVFELAEPLEFAVTGFATKAGHVVDLTGRAADGGLVAEVVPAVDCQSVRVFLEPVLPGASQGTALRLPGEGEVWRPRERPAYDIPDALSIEGAFERLKEGELLLVEPPEQRRADPSVGVPRIEVLRKPCLPPPGK